MKRRLSAPWPGLIAALLLWGGGSSQAAPQPGAYQLRYSFGAYPDGSEPAGGLVADAAGNLYGTTRAGGRMHGGVVYRIDGVSGAESVLHSFDHTNPYDAWQPSGAMLLDSADKLYGVATSGGGGWGAGAVFTVDLQARAETLLHSFTGGAADGSSPSDPLLLDANGNLFGTTPHGGANSTGILFEIAPDGRETVLASFGEAESGAPAVPSGKLALDAAGNLYGTTQYGGMYGYGSVWRFTPASGSTPAELTVLHSFSFAPADGEQPTGGVLLDAATGTLYGTTEIGGAHDAGTVFSCSINGSGERIVYSFGNTRGNDGMWPMAPLVMDSAGTLYGTTESGGAGYGTVFALAPATGVETVLHSFGGYAAGDGGSPGRAQLLIDAAGQLVGTTRSGGADDNGTVYALPR